jgi:hypothetical protein
MNLKRIVIVSALMLNVCLINAQKVNLANFYLIQDDKEILLSWTIDAGPTCNGIAVLHSIDSVNYNEIGSIAGICGSTSSSIPYNFKHDNPILNKTNYYKIRLGFSQFSEIKVVELSYIEHGKINIKPNPATENVFISFKNDKKEAFSVTIINSAGLKVFETNDLKDNSITINTGAFENGYYYIILMDSGGRTIKEKLIVLK